MNENQKTVVALLTFAAVLLVWAVSVGWCFVVASQPGQAGAMLGALFAFLLGWGFAHEARDQLGRWLES